MELTKFHKMRTAVQSNASPGSARMLREVQANLQHSLSSVGIFTDVEVGYTSDLDNLVIAMCSFPADLGPEEVARRLELLWQDHLRYGFWEAHTILTDPDQVELQGATRTSTDGHYVTVHLIAQRGFVPAQRTAVD